VKRDSSGGFGAGAITGSGISLSSTDTAVYAETHGVSTYGVYAANLTEGGYAMVAKGGGGTNPTFGGIGVYATGGNETGVNGLGGHAVVGLGGSGTANGGWGGEFVGGGGTEAGIGVYAQAGSGKDALAGEFLGDVEILGHLSKDSGSFKIDHPLDPANKYLYHSFVESPDMMNLYNGNVILDSNGEAAVVLPDWFGRLNRDFRYQLTSIGGFAPLYIAQKIENNTFKIAGGKPGMEVSWQVTGIRQDAWANAHRIPVEQPKSQRERGFFLHPELYGAAEEKGIEWARDPEKMKQLKGRHAGLPAMITTAATR
jgi:hypothetical protein